MDNLSKHIFTFIHFNVIIRDALEYAIKKEKYDIKNFKFKKDCIKNELRENTPLSNFIAHNGENGEKFKAKITDLYDTIYGDESTICQISGDELRVDSAQAITIFEKTLPLRDEITAIINLFLNEAKKNNNADKDIVELLKRDEKFYRGVVWISIIPEIERQFIEYNKARREANGGMSPQANFIQGELQKLSGLLASSRAHASATDREYTDVLDKVFDLLEEIQGRRELREGHTFETDFKDVGRAVQEYVAHNEPLWKEKFNSVKEVFVKEVNEQNAAQQKTAVA